MGAQVVMWHHYLGGKQARRVQHRETSPTQHQPPPPPHAHMQSSLNVTTLRHPLPTNTPPGVLERRGVLGEVLCAEAAHHLVDVHHNHTLHAPVTQHLASRRALPAPTASERVTRAAVMSGYVVATVAELRRAARVVQMDSTRHWSFPPGLALSTAPHQPSPSHPPPSPPPPYTPTIRPTLPPPHPPPPPLTR